eukprot:TRINITY_DN766_c0_g1_i3.p1 TRINITY_DN766_c0_g1~~TRINITY_DN766_c0_g1_i3.p1  ORF type:complete len:127 (-),score=33.11 TRINITY_DN766_c0_g1_i3:170-550(-)
MPSKTRKTNTASKAAKEAKEATGAPTKTIKKRTRKTEKKVPVNPKPKGPKSAWNFYATEHRAAKKEGNEKRKATTITKLLGKDFKDLDEESRKKYDDLAAADKTRYEKEIAAWKEKKAASAASKSS